MYCPNITLALLAGGKASRMGGTNKALLKHNGKTFVEIILSNLGEVFPKTIIIANEVETYAQLGVSVYADIFKEKGPLGGIHSALYNTKTEHVFAISCDMPLASAQIASQIAAIAIEAQSYAYVPKVAEMLEPLFAVYSRNGLNTLTKLLEHNNNVPIRTYLNIIPTQYIELPNTPETQKCFTNINTQSDFRELLGC